MTKIRDQLVAVALEWQGRFGVAPAITSALSEYDAATSLLGMSEEAFGTAQARATAVQKGYDFLCGDLRYQIKANRPSGRSGSKVTKCAKAANYDWDRLIWMLYDREYRLHEAWMWEVKDYREALHNVVRISPEHMRGGTSVLTGVEFMDGGQSVVRMKKAEE